MFECGKEKSLCLNPSITRGDFFFCAPLLSIMKMKVDIHVFTAVEKL